MLAQELDIRGDALTLTTAYDTRDEERANRESARENGRGFIRDGRGGLQGRVVANIPAPDAAMLEAVLDLDWLCFSRNNDRAAFRRLLARFPHWKACEGGV